MRILFLGMPGIYAAPHLAALLAAGVQVVALGVPAPPGAAPVAQLPRMAATPPHIIGPPPGLLQIASAAGLPVFALRDLRHPAVAASLRSLAPDLVGVACWPWRIPPALLALPRLGWLNSHPSALPALRGPAPLAEALQRGLHTTGVTIHWMDRGLDTGPIALQAELHLPAGISEAQAEALAAPLGGRLLVAAVQRLERGDLPQIPQPC